MSYSWTQTEVLGPKHLRNMFSTDVASLGDINLAPGTRVRNLGVNAHVQHLSSSASYDLGNINKVQHLLSQSDVAGPECYCSGAVRNQEQWTRFIAD